MRVHPRRRALRGFRTRLQAAAIAVWCLAPVYWMVAASLREPGEVYATSLLPAPITLGNYAAAFAPVNDLLPALVHSAGIAALVTGISVLLAVAAGYAVNRFRPRGRDVLVGAVLAGSMLPAVALLTPLFALFTRLGWAGSFRALIVPYVALALPFAVTTLVVFLRDTPWELEDAARVDGCTRPQAFVRVVLPLIAPAVLTVALLVFIATWNEYVVAFVLSVERTVTVTVVIANFSAELTGGAVTMAAGTVATAPLVALVLGFQRRITQGLTAGALIG